MRPQNMDVKYEICNYGNSTLLGMWPGIHTDVRHVTSFFLHRWITKFSKVWSSAGAPSVRKRLRRSWNILNRIPGRYEDPLLWAWLQFFYYSEVPILKRLNVTSQKLKWFLSIALRIATERVHNIRNFLQARLYSERNARFFFQRAWWPIIFIA